MPAVLEPTFRRLRDVLRAHEGSFAVTDDTSRRYGLEAPLGPATIKRRGDKARGASMPIAWVEVKKAYVSYHLMGIYMNPKLEATLSDALRARMQGKSCFNFKDVDEALFRELSEVTAESLLALTKGGYIVNEKPQAAHTRRR